MCARQNDEWMDTLISHLSPNRLSDDAGVLTATAANELIDDVVLALIRGMVRGRVDRYGSTLEHLMPSAAVPLRTLASAALAGTSVAMPPDADDADWLLLSRSGLQPLDLPAALFGERDGPWWWLATNPPTVDVCHLMLGARSDQRAAIGLLSSDERERVAADPQLRERIERRRLGRPLST
jgi:hypothetical protein